MSPAVLTDDRPTLVVALQDDVRGDLLEDSDELLIEEISIDGMCGVY